MPPKPKAKLKQKKFRDGLAHKLDRIEQRQILHRSECKKSACENHELYQAVLKLLSTPMPKDWKK